MWFCCFCAASIFAWTRGLAHRAKLDGEEHTHLCPHTQMMLTTLSSLLPRQCWSGQVCWKSRGCVYRDHREWVYDKRSCWLHQGNTKVSYLHIQALETFYLKSLKFYMYQTGILFVQLSFYPFSHPVCSVVIIWTHLSSLTNLPRTSPRSKHPAGFSSWHNIRHCHKHVLGHSMFWTS